MATAVQQQIDRQVRRLERRVDAQVPVTRYILLRQIERLREAEKLRRLASSVIKHRSSVGQVQARKLDELADMLQELKPFSVGRVPASVRKFLKETSK